MTAQRTTALQQSRRTWTTPYSARLPTSANERAAALPSVTDGVTDAEAEASATFDLTIDEVRSLKADRDAAGARAETAEASVRLLREGATLIDQQRDETEAVTRAEFEAAMDELRTRAERAEAGRNEWLGYAGRTKESRDEWRQRTAAAEREVARLRARFDALGEHKPGPALHAYHRPDGRYVHGDADWCQHAAMTYGGQHVEADTCGWMSDWREAAAGGDDAEGAQKTDV